SSEIPADRDRAARAMVVRGAEVQVPLEASEGRQDVGEAPSGQRPAVVVGRMPAQREGGVHRRGAAGDLAPRQAERRRASGAGAAQAPVVRGGARAVRAVRQIGWYGCGRIVGTRLEQQHAAGRVLAQPCREHTPGAARADDHNVVSAALGRGPDPRTIRTPGQLAPAYIHDSAPLRSRGARQPTSAHAAPDCRPLHSRSPGAGWLVRSSNRLRRAGTAGFPASTTAIRDTFRTVKASIATGDAAGLRPPRISPGFSLYLLR